MYYKSVMSMNDLIIQNIKYKKVDVHIFNIDWDIDDDEEHWAFGLPEDVTTTIEVPEYVDIDDEEFQDEIVEYLSNNYGYCVNGCEYDYE